MASKMNFTLVPSPARPMRYQGGAITHFKPTNAGFFTYMGCSKSEFTRFAAGLDFVTVYSEYRKIMNFVIKGTRESHLNALTWLDLHLNPDGSRNMERCAIYDSNGIANPGKSVIPFTLKIALKRYGHDRRAKNELFGCLLYVADQRGAHKQSTNTNEPIQPATSAQIYAAARTHAQWAVPTEYQTSGTWRKDRILPAGLRPECIQDYNEHICERWNRIWHCLQMVDYYKPQSKGNLMWTDGSAKGLSHPNGGRKR